MNAVPTGQNVSLVLFVIGCSGLSSRDVRQNICWAAER